MKKISFYVTGAFVFLMFYGCNGAKKYKTAYISKTETGYEIDLRGRGIGHPAGPGDVIFPHTFPDSFLLEIPSSQGIINFTDVKTPNTYNINFTKGNVTIKNKSLQVNLFSTNPDYPPNNPLYWNGKYNLEWKK